MNMLFFSSVRRFRRCVSSLAVLFAVSLFAACSSDGDAEQALKPNPPQDVHLDSTVQPTTNSLTFCWSRVEGATAYEWELRNADQTQLVQSGRGLTACSVALYKLDAATAYCFRVCVLRDGLRSDWSSYALGVTAREKTRLEVPEAVLKEAAETSLRIEWTAVEGCAEYAFELRDDAGKGVAEGQHGECGHTFEGLTENTAYRFRVKACPAEGSEDRLESDYSAWLDVRTAQSGRDKIGLPLAGENDGVVRAFPGAEGGGMYTTGGRGGEIYYVTNLNDEGEGSLRDALSRGDRTILFKVCGTIRLTKTLEIKRNNITIAGQTAPGQGITIADGTVVIKADNVIVRYLRFRLGDRGNGLDDGSDAFWGRYRENIIIDHCSMSWSIDEVASFYANRNFTMQWCVAAEALKNSKLHSKGAHGYGGIWGGRNASFHHNLLANNDSRNARIDHPYVYGDYLTTHRGHVDVRNNVIYNWGGNSTYGGEDGSFNLVGNYYKPGPASKERKYFVDANSYYSGQQTYCKYARLYVEGNYHSGSYAVSINANQWSGVYLHDGEDHAESDVSGMKLSAPLSIKKDDAQTCYTSTHKAADAYTRVLAYAGASLGRDAVDKRITDNARTDRVAASGSNGSTGGLIDSQEDVGGWPELTATQQQIERASKDTDNDGIPDYYEEQLGLDAADAADARAKTLDPQGLYTNLEVYLHWIVRDITEAQRASGSYTEMK